MSDERWIVVCIAQLVLVGAYFVIRGSAGHYAFSMAMSAVVTAACLAIFALRRVRR